MDVEVVGGAVSAESHHNMELGSHPAISAGFFVAYQILEFVTPKL